MAYITKKTPSPVGDKPKEDKIENQKNKPKSEAKTNPIPSFFSLAL